MNLTIVLVHNKGDINNQAQIEALKPLITQITDISTDPIGNIYNTYHYELQGLPNVQVKFFQIIPFGITNPPNLYDIDSFKVFYGKGDEDKIGDHPRFFNYGNKFAFDSMGADVVIHCDDYIKFTIPYIQSLLPKDKTISKQIVDATAKITTLSAFFIHGEVDETKPLPTTLMPFTMQAGKVGI